jgi:acetoin utilization protein AcuB
MIRLAELMTANPLTVSPDTCLLEILSMLDNQCCRQVPVVDAVGGLVGIITDRDLRLAMNSNVLTLDLSKRLSWLEEIAAAAYMTPDPLTVDIEMPVHEVAALLAERKFGALPVTREGVLVGIVTVTDFLRYVAEQTRPAEAST